tara:strand:- start:605 stop:802 length:198 start_codon:yes stop_codon:yes gene_type:complete
VKIGDIVTMKQALTPERYGLGFIQKIVETPYLPSGVTRLVYHILWPDGAVSCQFDKEIVSVGTVE